MNNKTIYHDLTEFLASGTRVALATIIETRGSVPREIGTKMIIHPDGKHVGTIGGGCGEGDVIKGGLEALYTGQSRVLQVDLTEDITMESLGICGGTMDVLIEPFIPE